MMNVCSPLPSAPGRHGRVQRHAVQHARGASRSGAFQRSEAGALPESHTTARGTQVPLTGPRELQLSFGAFQVQTLSLRLAAKK
jgi:hypothetical protein